MADLRALGPRAAARRPRPTAPRCRRRRCRPWRPPRRRRSTRVSVSTSSRDLVAEPLDEPGVGLGVVGGRQPALVVGQPGDVGVVPGAEVGHLRHLARTGPEGHEVRRRRPTAAAARRRTISSAAGSTIFSRMWPTSPSVMTKTGLRYSLGEVEGERRQVDALLHRRRRQGDDLVVAVGAPARLHHVALGGLGGLAGGGPRALHVDDDAGRLGHAGVADALLHEREARARWWRSWRGARSRRRR